MKSFWSWIEEKGFGFKETKEYPFNALYVHESFVEERDVKPQMLVGYMIEYLMEKKLNWELTIDFASDVPIEDLIKWLKGQIELLENSITEFRIEGK